MQLRLLLLILPALLAACAVESPAPKTMADKTVVCTTEVHVGSLVPRKECSAPMTEAERQRMVDELKNQSRQKFGVVPQGGG